MRAEDQLVCCAPGTWAAKASRSACLTKTTAYKPTLALPPRIPQRSICWPRTGWLRIWRGSDWLRRSFNFGIDHQIELVAEFDHAILAQDTRHPFVVQCEQFKTANLLLKRVERLPNVEVLFNHEVVDVRQNCETASIDVRGPDSCKLIPVHT